MNSGYFWVFCEFFGGILVYHYPPPPHLADPARWICLMDEARCINSIFLQWMRHTNTHTGRFAVMVWKRKHINRYKIQDKLNKPQRGFILTSFEGKIAKVQYVSCEHIFIWWLPSGKRHCERIERKSTQAPHGTKKKFIVPSTRIKSSSKNWEMKSHIKCPGPTRTVTNSVTAR